MTTGRFPAGHLKALALGLALSLLPNSDGEVWQDARS